MSPISIPSPLYHLPSHPTLCLMPPHSRNSPLEPGKIRIHSLFLHAQPPQMLPQINYMYRTQHPPPSSASETKTSHIPKSPLPVSSTTPTKKTCRPPYQQFHVVVPPFTHHLEEHKWPSPSRMTLPLTKPSSPPSLEYETTLTVATHKSGRLKRSSELLAPSNTERHPAKMTNLRHLLHDSTKSDDWNLDLSHLPLRHQHPLTSPFQHLPFRETRKSRQVLRPHTPESTQWPVDRLRPSNRVPKVPGVRGLKLATWRKSTTCSDKGSCWS